MVALTADRRQQLIDGWRFGGSIPLPGPEDGIFPEVIESWSRPDLDDADWQAVVVPHTVTPLSWRSWDSTRWEKVWAYRRELDVRPAPGERVFLDFDAVLTTALVSLNGVLLGEHRGGYLPFSFEITEHLRGDGHDVLAVIVDARFNINVPPNAPDAVQSSSIDYFQPGGIHRAVWLRVVPDAHLAELALTNHDPLDPAARRTTAVVTIDAVGALPSARLTARLTDADAAVVATATRELGAVPAGRSEHEVELRGLEAVELWDVDAPHLYDLTVALEADGEVVHEASRRTGYREARFELDGFYLNGRRRYLIGANRHEYFPFAGFSMPDRVHQRDAEILRTDLNCIIVRCSHYPQTPAFLDACDELGLLVWEESPGWHYIGDAPWQDDVVRDITEMIARDRHRPSVVIWGARLNETRDHPELYGRTEALVKRLDPTRATSGATCGDYSRRFDFQHDVFAYDDYYVRDDGLGGKRPDLLPPVEDRPYLISESVAARSSPTTHYRRDQAATVQQHQALNYAQAHDDARSDERYLGLITWIGFDYTSPRGNGLRGLRTTGLADTFRVLKPGSALYRAQIDPRERPVIEPAFGWDPESGDAGAEAMVCTNLDRIEFLVDGERVAGATPDRERFAHLAYAPTFVDLTGVDRGGEVRIDGYLGDELVLSREFSGDRTADGLRVTADDAVLRADGADGTRVVLAIVDRFGNPRTHARVGATIEVSGPAVLLGDEQMPLDETGAVAAVWVKTVAGEPGRIVVRVVVPGFGSDAVTIVSTAEALPA